MVKNLSATHCIWFSMVFHAVCLRHPHHTWLSWRCQLFCTTWVPHSVCVGVCVCVCPCTALFVFVINFILFNTVSRAPLVLINWNYMAFKTNSKDVSTHQTVIYLHVADWFVPDFIIMNHKWHLTQNARELWNLINANTTKKNNHSAPRFDHSIHEFVPIKTNRTSSYDFHWFNSPRANLFRLKIHPVFFSLFIVVMIKSNKWWKNGNFFVCIRMAHSQKQKV